MSMDDDIGGHGGTRALIGEYVLGLLDQEMHARVARMIAADPALAREEAFWQGRLALLDDEFGETAAPSRVLDRLETRLFGEPERTSLPTKLWNSLALWRGAAAAAALVAVVATGVSMMTPTPTSQDLATQLVAALEAEGSDVRFLALYDSSTGSVRLTGLSGAVGAEEDFELWAIQGGGAPISMGVIEANSRSEVPLSDTVRGGWGEGSVLAITIEPEGGSPTGDPTGPVVAQGIATPI
jgi:anti-sigma-K factor RskA